MENVIYVYRDGDYREIPYPLADIRWAICEDLYDKNTSFTTVNSVLARICKEYDCKNHPSQPSNGLQKTVASELDRVWRENRLIHKPTILCLIFEHTGGYQHISPLRYVTRYLLRVPKTVYGITVRGDYLAKPKTKP